MWRLVRLLVLLHFLLLLGVLLLHVLSLLLVALLDLLFLSLIFLLFGCALMFLVLLLLEFFMLLLLFRIELLLLLLIFLVGFYITGVRRGRVFVWRQFVWMDGRPRRTCVVRSGRAVRSRFWRGIITGGRGRASGVRVIELCRFRCRGNWRFAVIFGGTKLGVAASLIDMANLRGYWRDMVFASCRLVLTSSACFDSSAPPVVAHTRDRLIHNLSVVYVMDDGNVDVVSFTVVVEMATFPSSAFVTMTEVTMSIVDAAVKSDLRSPVAGIEGVSSAIPRPIGRSPQISDFRCEHPGARNPIIIFPIPRPISRGPDIAITRTNGLIVYRELRRRETDRNADRHLGPGTSGEKQEGNDESQRLQAATNTHKPPLFRNDRMQKPSTDVGRCSKEGLRA